MRLKPAAIGVVVACALAATGCGGSGERAAGMHVAGSDARLRTLLRDAGVEDGRGRHPAAASFRAARMAFERFGASPVAGAAVERGAPNDDLLFEFGVFDWGDAWGKTFEVDLVRQYLTADGDIQQVHLVAHFAPETLAAIRARLRRSGVAADRGGPLWASQTGADGAAARTRWFERIDDSPVIRALVAQRVRPIGYEVWQDSAE